jgi:hypothetical protein
MQINRSHSRTLSQDVWRSTRPWPSRSSTVVRLLTQLRNHDLKHPLCMKQITKENFVSIHLATTTMMETESDDYNVCDNSTIQKHWTTGSREKAKDRGESTIDMHMKMKNRDIKGGVPMLRLLLQ